MMVINMDLPIMMFGGDDDDGGGERWCWYDEGGMMNCKWIYLPWCLILGMIMNY